MDRKLVFFADDEKIILNLVEYVFNIYEGYELKTFDSGEACIEHLHLKPEVIVLDHNFLSKPGMLTGMEALRKVKEKLPCVKVIMLTAQGNSKMIDEFMEAGAYRYIAKDGFFIDTLKTELESLLVKQA
jgi:DNA-binding NtrC family response regulator